MQCRTRPATGLMAPANDQWNVPEASDDPGMPARAKFETIAIRSNGSTLVGLCRHRRASSDVVAAVVYTDRGVGFAAARAATERAATRYQANMTTITESIATATPAWWLKYRAPSESTGSLLTILGC